MLIRKAKIEDYKAIAPMLLLAMEDIFFSFIGEASTEKATQALEDLIQQKANQYSYENCWVMEKESAIIAVANVYDGARLVELRVPVALLITTQFAKDFQPEDETQTGEMYIDCLAVHPSQQGKGLGKQMVGFLIETYVHQNKKTLGLLVEHSNANAKKLYLSLGFEKVSKKTLAGKTLDHLQCSNYTL